MSNDILVVQNRICHKRPNFTHVGNEVQEGIAAQRADCQRHQEAEKELEENSVHERDEDDPEQREQADDGDGNEPTDPRCNTYI